MKFNASVSQVAAALLVWLGGARVARCLKRQPQPAVKSEAEKTRNGKPIETTFFAEFRRLLYALQLVLVLLVDSCSQDNFEQLLCDF